MMLDVNGKEMKWLRGTETGTSSETIFHVFTGVPMRYPPNTPSDPADFARCNKLLELFPEWKKELNKVSEMFPHWKPLIDNWDKMESIYQRDVSTGQSTELFKLMRRLNGHDSTPEYLDINKFQTSKRLCDILSNNHISNLFPLTLMSEGEVLRRKGFNRKLVEELRKLLNQNDLDFKNTSKS